MTNETLFYVLLKGTWAPGSGPGHLKALGWGLEAPLASSGLSPYLGDSAWAVWESFKREVVTSCVSTGKGAWQCPCQWPLESGYSAREARRQAEGRPTSSTGPGLALAQKPQSISCLHWGGSAWPVLRCLPTGSCRPRGPVTHPSTCGPAFQTLRGEPEKTDLAFKELSTQVCSA